MLVNKLINYAKRTPYFHLAGYMERYWLVPYTSAGSAGRPDDGTGVLTWATPIRKLCQYFFGARIHHILRSDLGRDPHDHPWPYLTIILKGGYFEQRYNSKGQQTSARWHGAGSILYRPANSWHKLTLPPGETAWTLFITGKYQNKWGFLTTLGKVPHNQYKDIIA